MYEELSIDETTYCVHVPQPCGLELFHHVRVHLIPVPVPLVDILLCLRASIKVVAEMSTGIT